MPTVFERIEYTGGCRGEDGLYTHPVLSATHDAGIVHRLLLSAHERLFRQWLGMSFVEQDADLWGYLAWNDRRKMLRIWPKLQPWHSMAPPGASERERQRWSAVFHAIFDDAIAKITTRRGGKGRTDGVRSRNEHEAEVPAGGATLRELAIAAVRRALNDCGRECGEGDGSVAISKELLSGYGPLDACASVLRPALSRRHHQSGRALVSSVSQG